MPPMRLAEKPKHFKATLKQLSAYVRPYYGRILLSLVLMVTSTVMCIYGPRLIGNVTTLLSQGILAKYKGEGGIDFVRIGELITFILIIYSISALIDYVVNILHILVAVDIVVEAVSLVEAADTLAEAVRQAAEEVQEVFNYEKNNIINYSICCWNN